MKRTIPAARRFVIAALLMAAFVPGSASPQAPSPAPTATALSPRIEPGAELLALAAGPAEPGAEALLEAGLLFSGTAPERRARAELAARTLMAEAAAMASAQPDPYLLGEALLNLLHERWLKRYVEAETTLDAAILEGRYNCVSSAVAYLILARAAGLEAGGVVTKDHSFCWVNAGGRAIDVETTNRNGWDPGTKKEFLDSFGRVTGYSYVPPSDYARRASVGGRHAAVLILWNRSTLAERAGRWAEALELSVDAYAYLGGDEARRHLAERAHNYAARYINARRWDEALDFLARMGETYGELGDLPLLARQAAAARLADELESLAPDQALARIGEAAAAGALAPEDRLAMLAFAWSRKALETAKSSGWLEAWRQLAAASGAEPASRELAELAANARANYVAETHNRFAGLYNARRYAEALAVMEEALAVIPGEKTFLRDADLARAAMARGG